MSPSVKSTRNGLPPFEMGLSGLVGETRAIAPANTFNDVFFPATATVSDSWAVNLDAQLNGKMMGVRGEIWTGQSAGTYFVAIFAERESADRRADSFLGRLGRSFRQAVRPADDVRRVRRRQSARSRPGISDGRWPWSESLQFGDLGQPDLPRHRIPGSRGGDQPLGDRLRQSRCRQHCHDLPLPHVSDVLDPIRDICGGYRTMFGLCMSSRRRQNPLHLCRPRSRRVPPSKSGRCHSCQDETW